MEDGQTSPPVPVDFRNLADKELIGLLLEQSDSQLPEGLPEEIVARGGNLLEPLCEILLRQDLWELGVGDPGMWAPVHALYFLGLVGSSKAAPALIELLRRDVDAEDIHTAGPTVLGRMGSEALDLIEDYVSERGLAPVHRGAIGGGALVYIGYHHPEHRPRIASFLVEMLKREDEDLEFSTFLALEAACIDDQNVKVALQGAIERGAVDDFIVDLDEVQERVNGTGEPWHGSSSDFDLMAELRDMRVFSYSNKGIPDRIEQGAEEMRRAEEQSPRVSLPLNPIAPKPGRRKKRSAQEKAKRKQVRKGRQARKHKRR